MSWYLVVTHMPCGTSVQDLFKVIAINGSKSFDLILVDFLVVRARRSGRT
jgi:hypothetical protein